MGTENHDCGGNNGIERWSRMIGGNVKVMDVWDYQGQLVVG